MNAASRTAVALVALALLGCGRHVVLKPELVNARNDPDWIIRSAPTMDASVSLDQAAAPSSGKTAEPQRDR